MRTVAEQLTRAGGTLIDLAAALPAGTEVYSVYGGLGRAAHDRVEVHIGGGVDGALAVVQALGGIWRHLLGPHEPAADYVHHYWDGTHHGAAVRFTAIWEGSNLSAEDIVPMVPVGA